MSAAPLCDNNLFADDTSAYVSSPCLTLLNTSLQSAADSLSDWFDRWHLSIHPCKTVCMMLHSRGMPLCPLYIYINGKRIAQVTQHCHLGVTFNDTLSWKDHVHKIVLQSARKTGLLRRLGRHLSPTVLRDIYLFCIRPGVEHSSVIWSGLTSPDAVRLERNNRSAARLILKLAEKRTFPMSFCYPALVCQRWKHGAMWPNARSSRRRSLADTRVIYRRLSPVGYYNQPLAANGNRREGTFPSKITTAKESEI